MSLPSGPFATIALHRKEFPLVRAMASHHPQVSFTAFACFVLTAATLSAQTRWDNNTPERDRTLTLGQSPSWQGSDWLGAQNQQQRRWQLGVSGQNRDTGVLVTAVGNTSAAARSRIEVGDLIVNVGGFQVGMVAGRVYDLAEEINRRADINGLVTLIIQDHRSGQLASVPIQLDSPGTRLVGTINYRDSYPLPADSIVTVKIENLTRPYYTPHNGTTSFRPTAGNSFPFEIAYDPTYIYSQDAYQVRATVTSGGRIVADTVQPQRVLTGGAGSQTQLTLASLTSPSVGTVTSAGYADYGNIDAQLTSMYRKYLNRDPSFVELAALRTTPRIESRIETMPLDIMASQEYFDLAGNNNTEWLGRVFSQIVKRPPSQSEMQQWMQRYAELRNSRTDLLQQLNSVVAR